MIDIGSKRFEWLLKQRKIEYVDENNLEQKISVKATRPDFFAWSHGIEFLVEVESFDKAGPLHNAADVGAGDVNDIIKRIRGPVNHAAKQLKPYADLEIPMIIVLDNFKKIGLPIGPLEMIQLFGTLEVRERINVTNGRSGKAHWHHGKGRTLDLNSRRKEYISAIAMNLPKRNYVHEQNLDIEIPMRLCILFNPNAIVPLSRGMFDDVEDEHYGYLEGSWVNLITSKRII